MSPRDLTLLYVPALCSRRGTACCARRAADSACRMALQRRRQRGQGRGVRYSYGSTPYSRVCVAIFE
eukprot:1865444-Pleurochrysis_carterae.AAC.1